MHQTRRSDPRAAKRRDIARSVLPSSARTSARKALQQLRRSDRRRTASALRPLRDLRVEPETGCSCPSTETADAASPTPVVAVLDVSCRMCDLAVPNYPLGQHLYEIWLRRAHDKVSPLIRWAETEIAGMERDEARAHLAAILPDDLIGDHAMSHLEWALPSLRDWPRHDDELTDCGEPTTVDALRSVGAWAIESRQHSQLNEVVRRALDPHRRSEHDARRTVPLAWRWRAYAPRGRRLLGLHDLDDWATDVSAAAEPDLRASVWWDDERHRLQAKALAPVFAWAADAGHRC